MGIYIHKSSDHSFSRGDGAAGPAKSISFNPTPSGLEADNVQDAVDEVVEALDGKQDALTNPLTQSDVVNNLTSTATNVPLSAAMGKSLNDALTVVDISSQITVTSAVSGGNILVERCGKFVQVTLNCVLTNPSTGRSLLLATGFPRPSSYATTCCEYAGSCDGSAFIERYSSSLFAHHITGDAPLFGVLCYLTID